MSTRHTWLQRTGTLMVLTSASLWFAACASTRTIETEYTPEGNVSSSRIKEDNKVLYELRRVFLNAVVDGEGVFVHENEGLARSTATDLAVAEMAGKVQTTIKRESVIYNQESVRQVVESQIHAICRNYQISFAGYEPGTMKYRVKVSITGEQLIREIESRIQ